MSDKSIIYVYNDLGVSPNMVRHSIISFYNHKIIKLSANDLINTDWYNNASLLVIPGGADLGYVNKLNGIGNNVIKKYVESGGSYLGICAGAYYSSGYVEFDKNGIYEVLGERELKFFPGKSIGPILANYSYSTNSGVRAAQIEVKSTLMRVYYNGGGAFENADYYPEIEIIARYKENNLAAIIKTNYGKGSVILSGVHFEVDPYEINYNDEYLLQIKDELQQDNHLREELLKNILPKAFYEYCDDLL